LRRWRYWCPASAADAPYREPGSDNDDQTDDDGEREIVDVCGDRIDVLSGFIAQTRETEAKDCRTECRVGEEVALRHAGEAGRKRRDPAHEWDEAAPEDHRPAMFFVERMHALEFVLAKSGMYLPYRCTNGSPPYQPM